MRTNPKIMSLSPPLEAAAGVVPNASPWQARDPDFRLSARALLAYAPKMMKQLNVDARWLADPSHQLGQGQFAVVWWLPDETRVLKVTFDATDAAACAAVATVSPLDGVLHVDTVVRLGDTGLFAIVAENAEPYSDSNVVKASDRARYLLASVASEPETMDEMIRRRGPADDPDAEAFFQKLLTGWRWLFKKGFYVADLHGQNVGWSSLRQQPVLIDLGSHEEGEASVPRSKIPLARNKGGEMSKVRAAFESAFDVVERVFPDVGTIELHVDQAAGSDSGFGSERQFGYCAAAQGKDPIQIAFAPKTENLPTKYITGLMRHEFGHAMEFRYGVPALEKKWGRLPKSIERRADKIAEHLFGDRIEYGENDVQCVQCQGKPSRPRRLG